MPTVQDILGPLVAAYAALDADVGGANGISPVQTGIAIDVTSGRAAAEGSRT